MKLASVFSDNMVIQANKPIRIFGEGKGNIEVNIDGNKASGCFSEDEWCLTLPAMGYGGPYNIYVKMNDNEVVLHDIYVGEVWLAMGQSNMEMPVFRVENGLDDAKYAKNDMIHFFTVPRRVEKDTVECGYHFEKTKEFDTEWELCNNENVLHFSAIGYYAAKELNEKLNVHIGIISCNWGATPVETWTKNEFSDENTTDEYEELFKEYLSGWQKYYDDMYFDEVEYAREKGLKASYGIGNLIAFPKIEEMPAGKYSKRSPGVLYKSMVSKIIPFSAAGVLWYQGESNECANYAEKYKEFISCMRKSFKDDSLKFYATELASYDIMWSECNSRQTNDNRFVTGENWAFTREEQQKAVCETDGSYLITTMEIGSLTDIHPPYKKELTHRMVLKILKYSYNFDLYADEPRFETVEFEENMAIIRLKNADGLYSLNPYGVNIFMADESKKLKKAEIEIKDNLIIAKCKDIEKPVLVRYAFDNYYKGWHIYNKAGLPLAPFRTDKD